MTPSLVAVMAGSGLFLAPQLGLDEGSAPRLPLLLAIAPSASPGFPSSSGTLAIAPPVNEAGIAQQPGVLAPVSVASEVMLLHGTNNNSGIDPRLGKMAALSKPPFSAYNSYKLLSQATVLLPRGQAAPVALPTGRQLKIVYKDVVQPQKPGGPLRYQISASIQSPNGKSVLPLVEVNAKQGEWFWVGGQDYQGGSLFIGIKIP